jgi:hypothetical protein
MENPRERHRLRAGSAATAESFSPPPARGTPATNCRCSTTTTTKPTSTARPAVIYKQSIPLANSNRKPGEWQTYDVAWTAPVFNSDGSVKSPAYVTVFFNGVLVDNHFELKGETRYIGAPFYKAFDGAPIKLQAHGDPSPPLSFRNIWIRELN